MNASPIFSTSAWHGAYFFWPVASNMRQTIVQNRRSAHSARRAHARILLSYEDQLYHQAE
jgi:hypothetical protein